jgi:hypothetical protein
MPATEQVGRVECYSGHTYAGEPRALVWEGVRRLVARVEERWRTPQGPAFRVRTEAGILFELHYRELDDRWAIRPVEIQSEDKEVQN